MADLESARPAPSNQRRRKITGWALISSGIPLFLIICYLLVIWVSSSQIRSNDKFLPVYSIEPIPVDESSAGVEGEPHMEEDQPYDALLHAAIKIKNPSLVFGFHCAQTLGLVSHGDIDVSAIGIDDVKVGPMGSKTLLTPGLILYLPLEGGGEGGLQVAIRFNVTAAITAWFGDFDSVCFSVVCRAEVNQLMSEGSRVISSSSCDSHIIKNCDAN